MKACKDCTTEGVPTKRPATEPGPRCATHWRAETRRRKATQAARQRLTKYGITQDDYDRILESQNGRCAVCQWAKGIQRALAVDHEHNKPGCTHPTEQACPNCIRALVCDQCNRIILGRYSIDSLKRAIHVLRYSPAQKVLKP